MRRGIVLVPEGRHVVTRLSVAGNIPSSAQGSVRFTGTWTEFTAGEDLIGAYL
jgi:ABC-type branched-subunit amino acid transport system ATPase component